jgi:hypothetical protein
MLDWLNQDLATALINVLFHLSGGVTDSVVDFEKLRMEGYVTMKSEISDRSNPTMTNDSSSVRRSERPYKYQFLVHQYRCR